VAGIDDYAAVRDLIHDIVAHGVEATVPAIVREEPCVLFAANDIGNDLGSRTAGTG
jgi:hypothetical protein